MDITVDSLVSAADHATLRRAFGAFATGVTVVTVGEPNPHGMTANSFCTVSLDPALVLVCVERQAVMHGSLTSSGRFGISVLGSDQESLARYFADRRRPLGAEQFAGIGWAPGPVTGAPLLAGAVGHFECELWRTYEGGDHTIFLGRLLSLHRRADEDALVFLNGSFQRIDPKDVGVER